MPAHNGVLFLAHFRQSSGAASSGLPVPIAIGIADFRTQNLLLLFFFRLFAFAFAGNNFYFVAFFVVINFHRIAFAQFAF